MQTPESRYSQKTRDLGMGREPRRDQSIAVALGAARLAQDPAGPTFGDFEPGPDMVDAALAPFRAQ